MNEIAKEMFGKEVAAFLTMSDVVRDDADYSNLYIVSDCDGVISDGKSAYDDEGKHTKTYGAYDYEMQVLVKKLGAKIYFCTSDRNGYGITQRRLEDHIDLYDAFEVGCDVEKRIEIIKSIKENNKDAFVVYFGDSLSDIQIGLAADYCIMPVEVPSHVKEAAGVLLGPQKGGLIMSKGSEGFFSEAIVFSMRRYNTMRYGHRKVVINGDY